MIEIAVAAFASSLVTYFYIKRPYTRQATLIKTHFIDKTQEYKQVLLIRTDLPMTKGKIAAQCCHATLAAYKALQTDNSELISWWESTGQAKVTLKVSSEEEMTDLMHKAKQAGICAKSVKDAGRTQILPGSRTVCAIGPAPKNVLDLITGHLKLY